MQVRVCGPSGMLWSAWKEKQNKSIRTSMKPGQQTGNQCRRRETEDVWEMNGKMWKQKLVRRKWAGGCSLSCQVFMINKTASARLRYRKHTVPRPLHQLTHCCCYDTPASSIIDGFQGLRAALTDMLTWACVHTHSHTHTNTAPLIGQGHRVHHNKRFTQEAIWQTQTHPGRAKKIHNLPKVTQPRPESNRVHTLYYSWSMHLHICNLTGIVTGYTAHMKVYMSVIHLLFLKQRLSFSLRSIRDWNYQVFFYQYSAVFSWH